MAPGIEEQSGTSVVGCVGLGPGAWETPSSYGNAYCHWGSWLLGFPGLSSYKGQEGDLDDAHQ